MRPRIQTTVIGSYPIPDWLAAFPSEQALLDATAVVIKTQENAGIDLVTDGELCRFNINHPESNGMIDYFVRPLENVRTTLSRSELLHFRENEEMNYRSKPSGLVEGEIDEGTLNLLEDYHRARNLTSSPLKFTVTGPHMLSKSLLDLHYHSRRDLSLALAGVLAGQVGEIEAEVVQIDEPTITGHPAESEWALECINLVLDAIPTLPAVHLCFGNYGGQTIQKGGWDRLIGFISGLHCEHVLLEMAHRDPTELEYLARVNPEIAFGLGVIDIKTNVIETADDVARRIDAAAEVIGVDRIHFVNPDCGFWMLKRSIADRKIQALVEGRDLFEGR